MKSQFVLDLVILCSRSVVRFGKLLIVQLRVERKGNVFYSARARFNIEVLTVSYPRFLKAPIPFYFTLSTNTK
jgi:hypothetical protein